MLMNGSTVKWMVVALMPIVLSLGTWVGSIEVRVQANAAQAAEIEKLADDVKEIDKKITAILCAVKPERCL